jgi:tetratricopeptide (TPR) repeat protein
MGSPSCRRTRPVVLALGLLLLAAPASAAPAAAEKQALALFQQSEVKFRAGDFQGAAEMLRRAYALYPEPTLQYNLGRALEGAGDLAGAIAAYTTFLAEEKKLIDRGAIEQQIQTLRRQLAERDRLDAARVEAERQKAEADRARIETELRLGARPVAPSRALLVTPWVLCGVGVLTLGVGGGLGGAVLSREDAATRAPIQLDAAAFQNDAHAFSIGANVSFGVGGALALAGLVWGIIEVRQLRAAKALR